MASSPHTVLYIYLGDKPSSCRHDNEYAIKTKSLLKSILRRNLTIESRNLRRKSSNELLIEAKVRLGEFSRSLEKGTGNRFTSSGVSKEREISKLGINPNTVRRFEKMTSTAFEIEKDKARQENSDLKYSSNSRNSR